MGKFIDQKRDVIPAEADFVKRKYLDIRYADGSDRRFLDIYLPNEGDGPYPVVIDIYGGAWYFGNRSSHKMNLALNLLKRGYAVVSIDYSLSWEHEFPMQIYEIKAAIRKVKEIGASYQLDTTRIAVLGESAGSHLGSVAVLSEGAGAFMDIPFGVTDYDASVQAMIALYCPTNLATTASCFKTLGIQAAVPEIGEADSPEGILFGGKLSEIPDKVQAGNGENYVTKNAPAFMFFHGDKDPVVPYLNSMDLSVKLMEAIGQDNVEYYLVPDAGHHQKFFMNEENYDRMAAFLKKHLR